MKGETEERKPRRRKKKSKFGYYLYAVVILILTITNVTFATWLLTYVQNIYVKGNVHSGQSEIVEWVKQDPMTVNSLYTLWKFKSGSYKLPVYLEDVDVRLKSPWSVEIEVQEKQVIGCIAEGTAFVYFDEDGLVLLKTTQYDTQVPLIEGLEAQNTGQYEYLKIKDEKVFSYLLQVEAEMKRNDLIADRIVWEEDGISLYFGGVHAQLGKSNFAEKIKQIPPILEELVDKEGVLHLEHYSSENKTISFEKNDEKNY